jgi:hypothetical protein
LGLFNMCNIVHVKTTKSNTFFLTQVIIFFKKITIIYQKFMYLIWNTQVSI